MSMRSRCRVPPAKQDARSDVIRGATLLLVVLGARTGYAAENLSLGLSYQAAPSCPDRSAFSERVRHQAPLVDLIFVGSESADVTVELREESEAFSGHL